MPFSVAFGRVSNGAGVHTAGWMLVATAAVAGALLLKLALGEQAAVTTDVDGADVVVSGDVGLELEPAAA